MGASILAEIDLPELIAGTPGDFVNVAAGLAGDAERLCVLRAGMRERMRASHLCDPVRYTPELERLFLEFPA